METLTTLGSLLDGEHHRDAVHIAIAPVTAGETLWPGDKLFLAAGTTDVVLRAREEVYEGKPAIGIADPFLPRTKIEKGQKFWLFMFPNTITGLRHLWAHPAFVESSPLPDAEAWLRRFADEWNFDYDELIQEASSNMDDDEGHHYIVARGISLHDSGDLGSDHELFWQHLQTMTGRTFGEDHRSKFGWSCSC